MKRLVGKVLTILNKRERWGMMKLMMLDLLIGTLDIAFLALMLLIINFYTGSSNKNYFQFQYLANRDSLWLIIVFFLLFSVKNCLGYYISSLQKHFFYNVASRLSKRNIAQYLRQSYTHFIQVDSSVEIRKIGQQPIEFSNYILINIQQIFSQAVLILFAVLAIVLYHPNLFLLLFLLLLPPVILLAYFIRRKLRAIRREIKSISEKTLQHLQESLAGFVESNIYGSSSFFIKRYHSFQEQLNTNLASQQAVQGLPARMIEIFAILGFLILLTINKYAGASLQINLLEIGIFMAAAYKIIPGIIKILNSTGQIKAYEFTLLDLSAKAPESTQPPPITEGISHIKFEQVSFQYRNQQFLKDLNFELSSGDFVGISGKSGAGKTTIINLLLGFLTPQTGQIYVNGVTRDTAERQGFWNRIAYIKQQQFIFNDSILRNITLSETVNAAKLTEVIAFCGLDNLIAQYANGVHNILTENGKNISGGQRQRIILARALYHDFDLLILDESFSEMDNITEKRILEKLAALAKNGKIILIITHHKLGLTFCNKMITVGDE